ncbi:MAG: 4-hydroxythreonine-4-phosphate dehydrogenase PdxA, partial [Planctomycetota bacterium]
MKETRPRIVITTGDPNGIGPEIAVMAVADTRVSDLCQPLLVGSPEVIEKAAESLDRKIIVCEMEEQEIMQATSSTCWEGNLPSDRHQSVVPVMCPAGSTFSQLQAGQCSPHAGRLAFESIRTAHHVITRGWAEAMVTCPISKEALHKAGCKPIAHTEILGMLCGNPNPLTLFLVKDLWIAFFTRHLSLSEAVRAVRKGPLITFVSNLKGELEKLGMTNPSIAMAALNPHCGEDGLLGWEEKEEIIPALEALRQQGIEIEGPVSADSVFHLGLQGRYRCIVSLYHDQGHIAAKTGFFHETTAL